jgi:MFS family permease
LGASLFFYGFLQRTAPSIMVPDLMRDFNVNAMALGGLSAFYFYAYMAVQIPTGLMADRLGPRRLLSGAALISAVGVLIFANAETLGIASAGRLLVGAGAGFSFICTLRIATDWFPPQRLALLSGMTMMMGMAGGVFGQAPLSLLVAEIGWRLAMSGISVTALVIAVGVWLLASDQRPKHTETSHKMPSLLGGLKVALAHPQTWAVAGFGFCIVVTMFGFGALWGVPYLQQVHNMSRPEAAFSASLILLGWGVFAPVVGWLSDRSRRRKPPMIAGAILSLLTIAPVLYMPGLSAFSVKVLLFVNGISIAGMVVCFATAREHNDTAHGGIAMALVNMAVIAAGAIMQPVIGWLLDLGWRGEIEGGIRIYTTEAYQQAFIVLPISCVCALILALLVRETGARSQAPNPRITDQ